MPQKWYCANCSYSGIETIPHPIERGIKICPKCGSWKNFGRIILQKEIFSSQELTKENKSAIT